MYNKPYIPINGDEFAEFVNGFQPTPLYYSQLFPLKPTNTFNIHAISGRGEIPIVAETVAFNSKSPLKSRKRVGEWSGNIGKISISRLKNELEINETIDGLYLAQKNGDVQAAVEIVNRTFDDATFCINGIGNKIEMDALRIMSQGYLDLNESYDGKGKGSADVINFNIPSTQQTGVTKKWSLDDADGLGDIIKVCQDMEEKDRQVPRYVFMSKKTFNVLINQEATKKRLSSALAIVGNLSAYASFSQQEVNSYMLKFNYPQIQIIDRRVMTESNAGVREIVHPYKDNVLLFSPTLQLGWTYYKRVPMIENTEAQQVYGDCYKLTRYSEQNPMTETTMAEAYVQSVLTNREDLAMLNIANTTWANGVIA